MARKKLASAREDGRGHWKQGRRRHEDAGGQWSRTRIDLCALINDHYRPGVRSARALAAAIGVSDRTVRRWLAGDDRPSPAAQERCRRWAAEQRDAIRPRRRR